MKKDSVVEQAHIADLSDEDLLKLIAFLWENLKKTDEGLKADEHIQRIEAELKQYKDQKYNDLKKAYRAKLNGARAMAKARNLNFDLPGMK